MQVVEKQGFHPRIVQVTPHGFLDLRQIVLVHHLVAFQVERPVAGAVEQGDRLLLPINKSLHLQIVPDPLVPVRVKDPDFGVADLQDLLLGVILARSQRDHEFIDNRQD